MSKLDMPASTDDLATLINVGTVKIKQEKLTPPSTPTASSSVDPIEAILGSDNLTESIFGERKPIVEPIKTSNEILADLFKVFNAAPPSLNEANSDITRKHKKKHKKEKKSKKHKKRGRSSSDENDHHENSSTSQDSAAGEKHKTKSRKVKKEKKRDKRKRGDDDDNGDDATDVNGKRSHKRHKKSKEREKNRENCDIAVKKEKVSVGEQLNEEQGNKSSVLTNDTQQPVEKITKRVKITGPEEIKPIASERTSTAKDDALPAKRKIVIKSLVNSAVYRETLKEVDAKEKEKENEKEIERERKKSSKSRSKDDHKREHRRSRSSSLSLSDEETYLKEREHRYTSNALDSGRDSKEKDRNDFYGDGRHRDRDREQDRRIDRHRHRDHSKEARSFRSGHYRHEHDRRRSRSSSRHRRDNSEDRIDKKRLLEIARKNAISMLKNGTLPGTQNMAPDKKEKVLAKMRYGGKSVDELTEFCKKLSKGEANGYLSNVSDESEVDADMEKPFHHPFVLKDRGPIVMNIKNSTPIPPKTSEQTKAILMQFPVSSGQHHRLNESEWVPVLQPKQLKKDKEPQQQPLAITHIPTTEKPTKEDAVILPPIAAITLPTAQIPLPAQNSTHDQTGHLPYDPTTPTPYSMPQQHLEPQMQQPQQSSLEPVAVGPLPKSNIFPDAAVGKELDVTTIITKRLNAMRKLQENPLDSEALKLMYNTQKDMSAWANSKFVPGQFTGSTGANILSTKELASGFQAWAKRDQLIQTTPVSGGMGMHLLQKMGWRPGEGLGKEKNGSLQPLLLEVKLDKKGLVAEEENPNIQRQRAQTAKKAKAISLQVAKQNFESKHPVSLLGELSAKRKFGAPFYELVSEAGPYHHRHFLFKVTINGQVYQPNTPSLNKKEAKAVAARYALQQMGVLQDSPAISSSPLQSVQPPTPQNNPQKQGQFKQPFPPKF